MANRTEQDAHTRIVDARLGCMVEATDVYLVKLRAELMYWMANINAELDVREFQRQRRREAELL